MTPPTKDTPDKLSERLRDEARRLYGVPGYGNAIPIMQQAATALDSLQAQLAVAQKRASEVTEAERSEQARLIDERDEAQKQLAAKAADLAAAKAEIERLNGVPHRCPICDGSGLVSRPPGVAADQPTYVAGTVGPWKCNGCDGYGILHGLGYIPRDSIKPQMELLGECLLLFVNISRKSSTNLWYMPFIAQLIKRAAELGVRP